MPKPSIRQLDLPLEIETWKDVPGYEGLYQVSDLGRVRSLPRATTHGGILKAFRTSREIAYLRVHLSKQGRAKFMDVHVLVAQAFIGLCPPGMQVNHKHESGDKTLNQLWNLEYVTRSENARHSHRILRKGLGANSNLAKLNEAQVRIIRRMCQHKVANQREIGQLFGVTEFAVSLIKLRKNWAHLI